MTMKKPVRVLVLSGGGAHTTTYLGLWDYIYNKSLNDRRYVPDYIIGTSGGALFGAFMAAGKPPRQILDELIAAEPQKMFNLAPAAWAANFLASWGIIDIEQVVQRLHQIFEKHDITWEGFKQTQYVCVAADVTLGRRLYLSKDSGFHLPDAVAASVAIPGVFTPLWRRVGTSETPHCLVDGGVCEGLPVKAAFDLGFDDFKIIALTPFQTGIPTMHEIRKMKDYFQMLFHTLHNSKIQDMVYLMEAEPHEELVITTGYRSKNMLDFSETAIRENYELGLKIAADRKGEIDRFFTE
jgi:predicted acylesterase/phospholipase RssA